MLRVRFEATGETFWSRLYAHARPVQYAYVERDVPLWHTQSVFAARPWAFEPASAGRPLTWPRLFALRDRGVRLARITHAAGLSSTGDPAIDAMLPLPERYEVPRETLDAIESTHPSGGRVVAVGTTVVRALESAARTGAREGVTDLRIGAETRLHLVDGILTGMHAPTESHYDLLQAFASREVLDRAFAHAEERGYLCHEFGDSALILAAA